MVVHSILRLIFAAGVILVLMIITRKAPAYTGLVYDVQNVMGAGDFAGAEALVQRALNADGTTSEVIEAMSWLGRGALEQKQFLKAERWAAETRKLVLAALKTRQLDAEPSLPLALGASIEVHAGVLNAQGQKAEAVTFLHQEIKTWHDTSIRARIQKNLNLLSLEGKPAPAFDVSHWLGEIQPSTLAQMKGHPVLLLFWAHWCNDCKSEISIISRLHALYVPRGLKIVGPTQHYGYAAGGEDATLENETRYIDEVRRKYYARIGPMPVPLSEENFRQYGASTTPTLVLIDRQGIVSLYHPGKMTEQDLSERIEKLLGPVHPGPVHPANAISSAKPI